MIKPDVRIVEPQQEQIQPAQVDSWEAEQLLRKYGYQATVPEQQPAPVDNGLTFEEMVAQEDARVRAERTRRAQMDAHRPATFDGTNGYHTETRYGSDDETGFGFRIQVTSDMPLPRY